MLTPPLALVVHVLTASTVPEPTRPPIQLPFSGPPLVSPRRVADASFVSLGFGSDAANRLSSLSVLPVMFRIQASFGPAIATLVIACPSAWSSWQLPVFGPLTRTPACVFTFQVKSLKQFVGANDCVAYATCEPSIASALIQPVTFFTWGFAGVGTGGGCGAGETGREADGEQQRLHLSTLDGARAVSIVEANPIGAGAA